VKTLWRNNARLKNTFRNLAGVAMGLLLASPALAQAGNSPWENAVNVLQQAFTSTIARGLSLVAIVVAGLTFAFGEGGSKRVLAWRALRRRHGNCGRELSLMAVSGLVAAPLFLR
jgi:type IV secretory pathway VirB2 component (pilin)